MQSQLKRYAPLALVLGILALLIAGGTALVMQKLDNVYSQVALVIGLLGLALAVLFNPEAVLKWLGGRQARYGGMALLMTAAFIGILVLLNYLVVIAPIPAEWKRRDLTQDQTNTLAKETVDTLKQLAEPVKVMAFYTAGNYSRGEGEKLLERYKIDSAGKLTYEVHDPEVEPALAGKYGITTDGTLIMLMGERREQITLTSEEQITNALIRLVSPSTKRVIYFLTGHGERNTTDTETNGLSQVADLLKNQNYTIEPLNLVITDTVPADAKVVVVAGPQKLLADDEVAKLSAYVQAGGSMIVMLDSPAENTTQTPLGTKDPLVEYLDTVWGITARADLIFDPTYSAKDRPSYVVTYAYGDSEIVRPLQNTISVFMNTRSLAIKDEAMPGITYARLAETSGEAWGETNLEQLVQGNAAQADQADAKGPLLLGVTAQNIQTKARLVVFGDSGFASNGAPLNQTANAVLFIKSLNWASADDNLVNITPKVPTTRTMQLTSSATFWLILLITVIILPLSVLGIGIIVWFQRHRHI